MTKIDLERVERKLTAPLDGAAFKGGCGLLGTIQEAYAAAALLASRTGRRHAAWRMRDNGRLATALPSSQQLGWTYWVISEVQPPQEIDAALAYVTVGRARPVL